ncbi:MAG: NAD(P)H-hydrate dehydratase, partial [Planctomycetia bacterium]|nr:NAD(P)H-hydrate dehydratase [Planctomycetia bacterium]
MSHHETESQKLPGLPSRRRDSHKGTYGTSLLIGGCPGMSGAIALAGMAALRSGSGLVRLAIPEKILDSVAGFDPCYTTLPMACDCKGRLSLDAEPELATAAQKATAIAVGPGLNQTPGLFELVARIYSGVPKPLVVDADALNCLSRGD